jgi:septal ring factor EnvC (AmiA/AmiB activator)
MKRSPSVPAEPEPAELIEEIRQLKLQLTQQISHQQQLQQQHEIMLKATRAQADSLREKLSESDREIERLKEQFKVDEAAVQKQRHDEQVEFAQREQLLRLQIFELQNSESKTIEQASPKSAVESDSHLSAPSLEVTEMRALISSMQNTTNSELDNGFKQHSLDLSLKLRFVLLFSFSDFSFQSYSYFVLFGVLCFRIHSERPKKRTNAFGIRIWI